MVVVVAGVEGYSRSATACDEERGGGDGGVSLASDGVLLGSLWSRVHQP